VATRSLAELTNLTLPGNERFVGNPESRSGWHFRIGRHPVHIDAKHQWSSSFPQRVSEEADISHADSREPSLECYTRDARLAMADADQPRIIRFGPFEVDKRTGELRKRGSRVKLQQQPLQILLALLQSKGDIVTREELRQQLWPEDTFVDFDHSLNAAVKRLREALGESADRPVFIETLARRGYRFIAPIDGSDNGAGTTTIAPVKDSNGRARRWTVLSVSIAALGLTLVWAVRSSVTRSSLPSKLQMTERKLTANSVENPIDGAAISPDGTYIAYSDATGLYLKLVRSGELHRIAVPSVFSGHLEGWLPDGAHVLVSRVERPEGALGLWNVPIVGGAPRKIVDDGWGASVSPDGTRIAFLRGAPDIRFQPYGRELWITRLDGSDAREVAPSTPDKVFAAPTWSPDGRRLAYLSSSVSHRRNYFSNVNSIELKDVQSLQSQVLLSGMRVGDSLRWLPDDRLVYSLAEEQNPADSNLWAVQVRASSRNSPDPVRLTQGPGWVTNISATANGTTLEFLRKSWQSQVLVARLASGGTLLLATRRLTLDENNDVPFSWTPDSKAIIFTSDRDGTFDVFRHPLDQPLPEPLVVGPENEMVARLNPAGTELLYQSIPSAADAPRSIFAIPLAGGVPRLVLRGKFIVNLQCAQLPSALCVYGVNTPGKHLIRRFDPSSGESSQLAEIPTQGMPVNWSLSPDGSQLAIILYRPDQGIIHLRSTSDNTNRDVVVKGRVGLVTADWAADGNTIFVTSMDRERKTALFNVELDGSNHLLLKDDKDSIEWAVPSPDGKLLAINEYAGTTNVWSLANF
jgi:Tol biopolymer transport system component/DNA-binding winged helix-turn-helix (wHTH) protein